MAGARLAGAPAHAGGLWAPALRVPGCKDRLAGPSGDAAGVVLAAPLALLAASTKDSHFSSASPSLGRVRALILVRGVGSVTEVIALCVCLHLSLFCWVEMIFLLSPSLTF